MATARPARTPAPAALLRRAALPLLGLALGACAPKTPSGEAPRADGKEFGALNTSARIYWEAVRWADGERAGVFIEDNDQRILFIDWLEEEHKHFRLEDVTVLQVVLGPEWDQPVDGRRREAQVWVRTSGYSMPEQILESERVEQGWYRNDRGWWVDWAPTPPRR
jgi:hypothetical protein